MAKRCASEVWKFYDVDCADESIANCNISVCHGKTRKIRRGTHGGSKKYFSTKSLWSHLESEFHPAKNSGAPRLNLSSFRRA